MKESRNQYHITSLTSHISGKYSLSRCIACDNSQFETLYKVNDTNQGIAGEWDLKVCTVCGLGVIDPFPSQEEIATFYLDQFYTEDGKRFNKLVEVIREILAWLRGVDLARFSPKKGNLLDFGTGAGHFAKVQKMRGWDVDSVDPYSGKAKDSEKIQIDGDCIILKFPDNYFDAVTLWYVIEHLRNPDAVITEISRVLKPGGILVLAQQDFSSIQARFFGAKWLILDPPRHIWQFSELNLLKLVARHNYNKCFVSHACIELGPFTILQSILNGLLGNENYLFRLLKNRELRTKIKSKNISPGLATATIVLGTILVPVSIILYYLLLALGSGDIFTLYLKRE